MKRIVQVIEKTVLTTNKGMVTFVQEKHKRVFSTGTIWRTFEILPSGLPKHYATYDNKRQMDRHIKNGMDFRTW